jgi:hypothetical protein
MGCDLVTALGPATVPGHSLLGVNYFGLGADQGGLCLLAARVHAPGEKVAHPRMQIPEVRHTARVLGWQAPGAWGLKFGANEHQLAAGSCRWKSRFNQAASGFEGADLVRLTLERAMSARHGVEVLSELIERHGQSTATDDHIFLLADPREAFVVEAAGTHWGLLECQQTRAVCDVALIRQDWQRLSRGLAEHVMEKGWWQNDGSKIDFHATLGDSKNASPAGLKRWSRATLALAQQEGAIDQYCLRRLLLEHFDNCQDMLPRHHVWQGTQIVSLNPGNPALMWTAPAHLGTPLFFPLVAGVPLPGLWLEGLPPLNRLWHREDARTQDVQDRLQATFDQDAEAFMQAARTSPNDVQHTAHEMMVRHADLYLKECQSTRGGGATKTHSRPDEMLAFISE